MIRRWIPLSVAPFLGILAMILPVFLENPDRVNRTPFFPILAAAVEEVGWAQFLLLFLAGLLLGAASSHRPLVLGLTAVLLLPAHAIVEMLVDITSHNLWPLEFVIYGFYGCVVAVGAAAIHAFRRGQPPTAHCEPWIP